MASVKHLQSGSADAIDDEWWSETAGKKRKRAEGVGSQRKRRKKSKVEDVQTEIVSSSISHNHSCISRPDKR